MLAAHLNIWCPIESISSHLKWRHHICNVALPILPIVVWFLSDEARGRSMGFMSYMKMLLSSIVHHLQFLRQCVRDASWQPPPSPAATYAPLCHHFHINSERKKLKNWKRDQFPLQNLKYENYLIWFLYQFFFSAYSLVVFKNLLRQRDTVRPLYSTVATIIALNIL